MTDAEQIKEAFEAMARELGWKPEEPVITHWQARPAAFDAFVAGWKAREKQE